MTKYIFWIFFSITQKLINHKNYVVVLLFFLLAIFCLANEHFSNVFPDLLKPEVNDENS